MEMVYALGMVVSKNVPSWEKLKKIGSARIVKMTILIPFVGAIIVFNEHLLNYVVIAREFVAHGDDLYKVSGSDVGRSIVMWRLYCLYIGLSFVGLGSFLFIICCPDSVSSFCRDESRLSLSEEGASELDKINIFRRLKETEWLLKRLYKNLYIRYRSFLEADVYIVHGHEDNVSALIGKPYTVSDWLRVVYDLDNLSKPIERIIITIFYVLGFLILLLPTVETFWFVWRSFASNVLGVL